VKDLLQTQEDVAAQKAISDWVLQPDYVVIRSIVNQLNNSSQLALYDGQILFSKNGKERRILAALLEVVESIEISTQMANNDPATPRLLEYV
jgi:hypothetical protein